MDEGVETVELGKLCQADKETIWVILKNNQNHSFNDGNGFQVKLICNKLIPTKHTFHITFDRAILLYAMIWKIKVDAGWITYNNIINSVKLSKGLWCPPIITLLWIQSGVGVEKHEEKIMIGLAISAKASTDRP